VESLTSSDNRQCTVCVDMSNRWELACETEVHKIVSNLIINRTSVAVSWVPLSIWLSVYPCCLPVCQVGGLCWLKLSSIRVDFRCYAYCALCILTILPYYWLTCVLVLPLWVCYMSQVWLQWYRKKIGLWRIMLNVRKCTRKTEVFKNLFKRVHRHEYDY